MTHSETFLTMLATDSLELVMLVLIKWFNKSNQEWENLGRVQYLFKQKKESILTTGFFVLGSNSVEFASVEKKVIKKTDVNSMGCDD